MVKKEDKKPLFKLQYYPNVTGVVHTESYKGVKSLVDASTYETLPQKLARMQRGEISGLSRGGFYDVEDAEFDDKGNRVGKEIEPDSNDPTLDPDFDLAHYGAMKGALNEREQVRIDSKKKSDVKARKDAEKLKLEAERKAIKEREAQIDELLKNSKK